jgi:hypothetical protein
VVAVVVLVAAVVAVVKGKMGELKQTEIHSALYANRSHARRTGMWQEGTNTPAVSEPGARR